jgi:Thioredoxin
MNTTTKKLTKQDYRNYLAKGISYAEYLDHLTQEARSGQLEGLSAYVPQNLQRMNRIAKTLELDAAMIQAVGELAHPTHWLVLSEHWCGDAAQSLPVLQAIAQRSGGKIDLKIVYRDANPELMDAYLTGQSRSIPKVIQLDSHLNLTGIWGPRPNVAQKLVLELKANPETAPKYAEILHKWYADDRQQSIQRELLKLLHKANQFCADCFV